VNDDLGRTEGLPLTDEQRRELATRQSRLADARAALDAAQDDRDSYLVELSGADVATSEIATALGLHRASVEQVVTTRREAEVGRRLAEEAPRAAARADLDRAQERVERAWRDQGE